jgi:hypothetical protein
VKDGNFGAGCSLPKCKNGADFEERFCFIGVAHAHWRSMGKLAMDAEEYRRRARRCLVMARQSANPAERARAVDTAMMWVELADWAEGKWPEGKQQQEVQSETLSARDERSTPESRMEP